MSSNVASRWKRWAIEKLRTTADKLDEPVWTQNTTVGKVRRELEEGFGDLPSSVRRALDGYPSSTKLTVEWVPSDALVYRLAEDGKELWRMT